MHVSFRNKRDGLYVSGQFYAVDDQGAYTLDIDQLDEAKLTSIKADLVVKDPGLKNDKKGLRRAAAKLRLAQVETVANEAIDSELAKSKLAKALEGSVWSTVKLGVGEDGRISFTRRYKKGA